MQMTSRIFLFLIFYLVKLVSAQNIKGLCLAPARDVVDDTWVHDVKAVGTNYIQLSPVAISKYGKPMLFYDKPTQYYYERSPGVIELARITNKDSINVMIKPIVFIVDSIQSASFRLNHNEALKKWQTNYSKYILLWAGIAQQEHASIFCIGSHLNVIVESDTAYWFDLINKIRQKFKGALTYESGLEQAGKIPFWNKLDYIGIDAEFNFTEQGTADVKYLMRAWQPVKNNLRALAEKNNMKVIFTSWGYRSISNCAGTIQLQPDNYVYNEPANNTCQAVAYAALLISLKNEKWYAGGFCRYWKLNANVSSKNNSDYSPQNKTAGYVLKKVYTGKY